MGRVGSLLGWVFFPGNLSSSFPVNLFCSFILIITFFYLFCLYPCTISSDFVLISLFDLLWTLTCKHISEQKEPGLYT